MNSQPNLTTGPFNTKMRAPFREPIGPFKLTEEDESGKVIGVIPLDYRSSKWRFLELHLILTNIAPIVGGYNNLQIIYEAKPSSKLVLGRRLLLTCEVKRTIELNLPVDIINGEEGTIVIAAGINNNVSAGSLFAGTIEGRICYDEINSSTGTLRKRRVAKSELI